MIALWPSRAAPARRLAALMLLICLALVGQAQAQVAFTPSATSIPLPTRLYVGTTPVGEVIWTSPEARSRKVEPGAPAIAAFVTTLTPATLVPGYTDVYSTNIAGIGVRWHNALYGNAFPGGIQLPATGGQSAAANGLAATLPANRVWFELVRTAATVGAGSLQIPALQLVRFNCGAAANCRWETSVSGAAIVSLATCDLPASISVALGNHRVSELTGVGAATPWVPFTLALRNCPASYSQLLYRLTPAIAPVGDGMLGIRPGGATGVVVELWDDTLNMHARFLAGMQYPGLPPGTPAVDLPFRARILQTAPAVTPGAVETQMEVRIQFH